MTALRKSWKRYGVFAGTYSFLDAASAIGLLLRPWRLVEGPEIARYESDFAAAAGARHAVTFGSGRMALYALLEALDIGPGDEVIVPAFTCVVVANAILYRGAAPVYADIDPETYNLAPESFERHVGPRTRAVIAQHTFGLVCDIDRINQIARARGVIVIEDAAHALGASHNGRRVGSLASAAYFSTDHTKVIGTGAGGVATTDDRELSGRLREIQGRAAAPTVGRVRASLLSLIAEVFLMHPRVYRLGSRVFWRLGLWRRAFFLDELETRKPDQYPVRLSNAQAALGVGQLQRLEANLAWRRKLGLLYEEHIGACAGQLEPGAANHAFLRYTFDSDDQEALENELAPVLDMGRWFTSVVHGRDSDLEAVGYTAGSCPNAEAAVRRCVNLPTHQRVDQPGLLIERLPRSAGRGLALRDSR